jgi:hypothetical protein
VSGAIPPAQFLLGCALLAVTLGCSARAAAIVVRRRLDHLVSAPRAVAFALLTIASMLLVHLVPLTLGVLSRGTVLVSAVVLLAAVRRLVPAARSQSTEPAPEPPPASGIASRVLAGCGVLLTIGYALAFLHSFATVHPVSPDALNFHLPGVIRFIQSGTLWQTTNYLPGWAFGNYPQYGDLMLLAGVLPWHSVALVRFVDPLLLAVAGVSVYAIARELHAPAPLSALAACAVVAIKPAVGPALVEVMTDPTFLAGFGAGSLFLIRHWRTGRRSDLVLAGVGLGIAFGTKWYGLSDVPALVVIWALAALLGGRQPRLVAADAGRLIAVVALTGGIWLVRNLILTGNPVFDYKVSLFGLTIFNAPHNAVRAAGGFSIAHYLPHARVLRTYVWPVWRGDFGVAGAILVASAVLAAVVALLARVRRSTVRIDPRITLLALAALAIAVAYVLTPFSAQGPPGRPLQVRANTRYVMPALLLAAPVLAWIGGRLGAARLALEAVLLVTIAANLNRHLAVGAGHVLLAAFVAAAVAGAWRWGARGRSSPRRVPAASAAAIVAVCGLAGLLYHYQRVLARTPYSPNDPAVQYALLHAPSHTRIGLTGVWSANGLEPVAPLFGPRLENRVEYVGPVIDHMLSLYRTPSQFLDALRRGHYALLMIGTGSPPASQPQAELVARDAGFLPVARSRRLVLLAARR